MPKTEIYLLSPRDLSPETIAVTFAKTSRSPESFREIASELTDEQSARFHERWVVGYGHASVAEHAVLHIAIENVSRLAVECIESNRLASYTEKSTRYQKWDQNAFILPPELEEHPLRELYTQTCTLLFSAYAQSLEPIRALVQAVNSRRENEAEDAYDRRIRSQYVDACRFLLPASSLANLGMTANARVLEHAICKMLSHSLEEVRQLGERIKAVAQAEIPTLVKYAAPSPYLVETSRDLGKLEILHRGNELIDERKGDWCVLHQYDPEGELKVLAAALYRFSEMDYFEALDSVQAANKEELALLAGLLLGRLGDHDAPLRELEYTSYTFDVILDQGAFAELKRHRMMTITPQPLTARLGYSVPRMFEEAGCRDLYCLSMDAASSAFEQLAGWNPDVAAYLVPNGFNRRVLVSMNLRQAFAFCKLRAAPNAHFSMRRLAQRLAGEIRRVHPLLAKYLLLPRESWQEIEQKYL